MMTPAPHVPQWLWDYVMQYACDTNSFNLCRAIGTFPYMTIIGQPVNLKYLQTFWSSCYVFIPAKERNKVGDPRAYKAHFMGNANTASDNNRYSTHKESKDVTCLSSSWPKFLHRV